MSPENQPAEQGSVATAEETKPKRSCKVVLYNDEDHTYDYVVQMLTHVCRMAKEQAFRCAVEVDLEGRTIVYYGSHAECARICAQITSYGPDHRLMRSRSGMNSEVQQF
jgi:ATP-dependent Clp protease adaptor protein ClpS